MIMSVDREEHLIKFNTHPFKKNTKKLNNNEE